MRDGDETGSSPEDALASRLYQRVTEAQEPQFAAGYDVGVGLGRYRAWLREHSEVTSATATPAPTSAGAVTPDAGQIWPPSAAGQVLPPSATGLAAPTERAEWSPDLAVIEMYSVHYAALVRLAAMLVRDTPTAEEVVQDSFIAMHDGWDRLRDTEKALAYMRQAVVNRSRSVLRHRTVVEKNAPKPAPDMPSAEHGAMTLLERSAVIAALRDLPERQREAIVLRYYADLSEAEIAAAMRISRGAVKSHTARGMATLRTTLEQDS